jgi:nucleotidyltransferase substrate binding protein (TIGR01987 family)
MLDLSALKKVLNSLERAIERSKTVPEDTEIRDSVIQRFEYSYELSWKMMKRQLEMDSPTPIDVMGFKDMIRAAAERDLINNPEAWFEYRRQRNITAHTYNEIKAVQVYETALIFMQDAKMLLQQLQQRNS